MPGEVRPHQEGVPPYSWYALGVLVLVYLLNFVDRQILSILANDIKADLGLDDAQLGFLYGTAFAIFYALFGIPLGRLADSWHRVRLLSAGIALWSCMTALSGLARNMAGLTVARIGVGVGEASASPCAYSLIGDWFPQRLRATALAIYSSGLFLGSGISLVVGGAIAESWNLRFPDGGPLGLAGWQAAFLAVGIPGLPLALWMLTLREPKRGLLDGVDSAPVVHPWRDFLDQILQIVPPFTLIGAARRGKQALRINVAAALLFGLWAWVLTLWTGSREQFWFLAIGFYAVFSWAHWLKGADKPTFRLTWGSPAFMAIVLAYGMVSFVGYAVTYWAAPYAERSFPVDKYEIGWLIGAPAALGGFVGVILGGRVADVLCARHPAGRAMVVTVGLLAPVPLVLLAYTTGNPTVFFVCSFLLQVATSSALAAAAAASQALVLPRMRGTATAIFFLGATLLGLGLGPFTAGFVSEWTSSLGIGVIATLSAVPIGTGALAFAVRVIPETATHMYERARAAGEILAPLEHTAGDAVAGVS